MDDVFTGGGNDDPLLTSDAIEYRVTSNKRAPQPTLRTLRHGRDRAKLRAATRTVLSQSVENGRQTIAHR